MIINRSIAASCVLLLVFGAGLTRCEARGFKGGGGGGGFRGGGGGGGGFSRPASMPHMGGGGNFSRPNVSRPSVSRPNVSRPNVSLPSNMNRPSVSRPNVSRPSIGNSVTGGLKPATRPSTLPANRPATRPSIADRPNKLPGNATRPNIDRPNIDRPNLTRPSNPSLGGRPTTLPGRDRPTVGKLDDFLGIDRPVGSRPNITRPNNDRPNIANRPSNRPSTRPGISRPDFGDTVNKRPINIGELNVGNSVINNRPSWVNIDRDRVNNLQRNWGNQIGGLHNYAVNQPGRVNRWHKHGNDIRFRWNDYHHHGNWFAGDWWYSHPGGLCRWHYYHSFNRHPWRYWWTVPTFAVATSWFTWQAPAEVWSEPIYYDYGTGGNVTYEDNRVYVSGEPVASTDDFAESAAALATVTPPADDEAAESAEWLPLGTFALSTDDSDVEPTRVVQLAVDKSGIIAGTLYNRETDQSEAIQGRVDKQTQRCAFRIGDNEDVVAETGLYNLTQTEAPLLVHFGKDRHEEYVLVRLDAPEEDDDENDNEANDEK